MTSPSPRTKEEILESATPLFAEAGYNGVSMRRIAQAVGLNAASLYHHFPDKETLYIEALKHIFAARARILCEALNNQAPPEERLYDFVLRLCRINHSDPTFSRLVQREILDGDERRLRLVAEKVFGEFFKAVVALCREIAQDYDPVLTAISLLGTVVYHYQTTPMRVFLPGVCMVHDDPEQVARHISTLLLHGLLTK